MFVVPTIGRSFCVLIVLLASAAPIHASPPPSATEKPLNQILSSLGADPTDRPAGSLDEVLRDVREETGAKESDTVMEQGRTPADREITARIRREIMGEDGLSFSAKNIAVITRDGVVTLRGWVKNHEERRRLVAIAERTVSPAMVNNAVEVR